MSTYPVQQIILKNKIFFGGLWTKNRIYNKQKTLLKPQKKIQHPFNNNYIKIK